MGKSLNLTASDGHRLGAYRADPSGAPVGGIVVIQEIFGVNHHIRNVCDRFAAEGYAAVAPALFDRQVRDFQSGYSPEEIEKARKFVANPDWDAMLRDTAAAIAELKSAGPVSIIGFCMGGTVAFLAAARLDGLTAAVGYYGGRIVAFADEKPRCPTQLHFGDQDQSIPLTDVETIKQKRPDCDIHIYKDAGHGFHCDERGSYHEPSSRVAWERTLAWLKRAREGVRKAS
ncbi:MAG: dienelactone hydrolase family protein [Xanthobacteraceae bacterium]